MIVLLVVRVLGGVRRAQENTSVKGQTSRALGLILNNEMKAN
jgi:hypothetical protein